LFRQREWGIQPTSFGCTAHGAGLRTAPTPGFERQRQLPHQFQHAGVAGVAEFAFLVDVEERDARLQRVYRLRPPAIRMSAW
jgi:hypothetical protein